MKIPSSLHFALNLIVSSLLSSLFLASCFKKDFYEAPVALNSQDSIVASATVNMAASKNTIASKLAFPGATGFAKTTRGAYGKYAATGKLSDLPQILYVDNLEDHGPGSLREALLNKSPRIIIFRTGGTINLHSTIGVRSPYVTVAGYTAPGGGICIRGATVYFETSEVIIRNIRSRNGVWARPHHGTDCISISANGNKISNIIVDHCSASWASDEQIGINGYKGGIENVTIQNCIIGEGFEGHAYGILCYGEAGSGHGIKNVSIHRNLFENLEGRSPRFGDNVTGTVINNLMHNWLGKCSQYNDYDKGDILYNKFKTGKNTTPSGTQKAIELVWDHPGTKARMYITGNVSVGESKCVSEYPAGSGGIKASSSSKYYDNSIYGFTPETNLTTLEKDLLPTIGAFPRDMVDDRFVKQYSTGTGSVPKRAGTYPVLASGKYPSNNNGVSLAWLISKKYASNIKTAAALTTSFLLDPANGKTGYSIIEEYINDQSLVK